MYKTSSALAGLAVVVMLIAGCGGTSAKASGAGGAVAVIEGDIFLDQPEYHVQNGPIQITVTNAGKVHHDLRVRNQPFFVETVAGETGAATVTLPKGTYDLFCSIPGHSNAKARLIVE